MMRCTDPTSRRSLDAVDGVELGGDLAELLGAHQLQHLGEVGATQVRLLVGRRRQRPLDAPAPARPTGSARRPHG